MNNLLVVLLSFYPSLFLYSAILSQYRKNLDSFASSGFVYFAVHFVVLAFIFFIVHTGLKKLVSFGYLSGAKRGFVGISIMTLLVALIVVIVFYNFLPGATLYPAPLFIQKYLLAQPYTLIAYILPFIYLFF